MYYHRFFSYLVCPRFLEGITIFPKKIPYNHLCAKRSSVKMRTYTKADVEKLKRQIHETDESKKIVFDIETFVMTENNLSIGSCCREEWGKTVDIDTDEFLSEDQAGKLCQKILDSFNNDNISKR